MYQLNLQGYLHYSICDGTSAKPKWKKSWVVLKENAIRTFRAPEDPEAKDSYAVLGYDLNTEIEVYKKPRVFESTCSSDHVTFLKFETCVFKTHVFIRPRDFS